MSPSIVLMPQLQSLLYNILQQNNWDVFRCHHNLSFISMNDNIYPQVIFFHVSNNYMFQVKIFAASNILFP